MSTFVSIPLSLSPYMCECIYIYILTERLSFTDCGETEMEDSSTLKPFLIGFATILGFWVWWRVVQWVWLNPKKLEKCLRQQGYSGNSYKFLHGDMKEVNSMTKQAGSKPINLSDDILPRILPFHHHIITNYGKESFIWNGPRPSIHITDPKLIREIFSKYELFQKPRTNPLGRYLVSGMVMYEGQQWFKVRKIANPAFHLDKLKDMLPKLYLSCGEMIYKWKTACSNEESHELDVWPYIQTLTADVISRTAFGSSYKDGRKIFKLLREQAVLLNKVLQFVYIPGWRFLPTPINRKMKRNHNKIEALIKGIINKREEATSVGESSNDDLLGMLLESNRGEIKEHERMESGLSIQEVIEECKLFYLAGQETTSSLLLWTMFMLCLHPEWQALAREEILHDIGNNKPTFDDLNHLKVVTKILYEVLRLYPPASLLSRMNTKETKLGENILPAGVILTIPIIMIHHDHELWGDDAKVFNPNRFSEGISKASKDQVSFFPFGGGPRICIGQNFALMEAKLALTMVLQNFSFELSPTYVHAPTRRVSIQPEYGAPIILRKI